MCLIYKVLDMVWEFDKDGVIDSQDGFSKSIDKKVPGRCGYREGETDSYSDDVSDCDDEYPQDRAKTLAGK